MRKWHITIILTGILFKAVLFCVMLEKGDSQKDYEKYQNVTEKQTDEKNMQKDGDVVLQEETHEMQTKPVVQRKIELMDYAGLPIEEFTKETEMVLRQRENNLWETEDKTI